jgi:hypothetical protein
MGLFLNYMELICYHRMGTNSRRAMRGKNKRWGWLHFYRPRKALVERLSTELGWNEDEIRDQIAREHQYLRANRTAI